MGADDTKVAGKDGANIAGAELTNAAAGMDDTAGRGFAAGDEMYVAAGADDAGACGKGFAVDNGRKLPEAWNVGQQVTGVC